MRKRRKEWVAGGGVERHKGFGQVRGEREEMGRENGCEREVG
jgi:hypothetical protein